MPPVKYALILLPVYWPCLPFEDFAQFQLLPRACKHISALISSQIFGHKKHRPFEMLEDFWLLLHRDVCLDCQQPLAAWL